jgi:hypothetical protein
MSRIANLLRKGFRFLLMSFGVTPPKEKPDAKTGPKP